jgi:hypothetical protein
MADVDDFSRFMRRALLLLVHGPSTATLAGAALTGRRSAYGPQTSAREGGCTLAALRRRGFVDYGCRLDEVELACDVNAGDLPVVLGRAGE